MPSDPAGLSSPDRFARRVAVRVLVAGEMA
jgi:hypothetical protein